LQLRCHVAFLDAQQSSSICWSGIPSLWYKFLGRWQLEKAKKTAGLDVATGSWSDFEADRRLPTTLPWLAASEKNLSQEAGKFVYNL